MRVLITASTFPRYQGDTEPEFILQLASSLALHHDVTVLVPHTRGAAAQEQIDKVRVIRFRYAPAQLETLAYEGGMMTRLRAAKWRWLLVPFFVLGQLIAICRLFRQHQFDLVHAHWILPQGLVITLARHLGLLSVPVLITAHGGDLFGLQGGVSRRLKHWVLQAADRINVVSSAMVKECEAQGGEPEKIWVRSMGVDLQQRFVPPVVADKRQGVVFVGRLVEKKGVAVLLQAFADLLQSGSDTNLEIIGDGPLRGQLEQEATRLGCADHVNFRGAIPNRAVVEALHRSRVAVTPSIVARDGDQEGLGLVIVEAQGCRCAVIASDLEAIRDVVTDGENGLLVPAGDAVQLADAMGALLTDELLAHRLADNGRCSASAHFDWTVVAADYTKMYKLMAARQPGCE